MKTYQNNYLSEFEREFEFNGESNETADEFEADNEENESGLNDEYEFDSEDENESDNEWEENENEVDNEVDSESWSGEYGSPDREYEDRLYAALSGEYENSFEMEQEIDRVLYEMEVEYFWKSAKRLWNKHKNKITGIAGKFLPKGTLQALGQLAGGDIRGLLKSDLFKKGLAFAANAVAPGVGGAVVGGLMNSEVGNPRAQASQAVQVAKAAYQNMAQNVTNLRPGNVPAQISNMSRQALTAAKSRRSAYRGKRKRVIAVAPNSIVVVRPDRIIIYS